MIIVNDKKEAAKEILSSRFGTSHVILDFEHIGIGEDGEKMKHSIDILNLIFFYCRVQKMYNSIGFKEDLDYSILYEVIDHVLMEKPFNDSQLIRYYELKNKFDSVINAMYSLISEDDYYLDYEVDFILLGLTTEELKVCIQSDPEFEPEFHDTFSRVLKKLDKEPNAELIIALKKLIKEAKVKAANLNEIREKQIETL